MAGDLPLAESVVVHPRADSGIADSLTERINDTGGRVLHRFGPQVLIGQLTEGTRLQVSDLHGAVAAAARNAPDPDDLADLDDTGRLGLQALRLRETPGFLRAKAHRPLAGKGWGTADAMPPDAPSGTAGAAPPDALSGTATALPTQGTTTGTQSLAPAAALPTSARMTGVTAVGLIIVQGPTADLQFTDAERTKVVAEVQNGLGWLATMEPGGSVSWSYEIRVVSITTTKGPDSLTFAEKEDRWRNPVMAALGFSADFAGVTAYVQGLRNRLGTEWAYCAFFTKYPIGHFAYASIGGPRLVMDNGVDGWTIENMDRVFAHETGHIFGAPDEYASSGCNCAGSWGFYGKPNTNCESCAPGGGTSCLMRANDWAMCSWTPAHLGFGPVPLMAKFSGKVADFSGGSTAAGAQAVQSTWNGGVNQQFRADPVGGGYYRLVSLSSGNVLTVADASTADGAKIVQQPWNGGDSQLFRPEALGDGYYRILAKHSGKALDVTAASTADGANLQQWTWGAPENQRWRWIWGPIRAKHSGKVLDVPAASTASDISVAQDDYNGGNNQQFRLDPIGDGWYRIVAQHSTKVLEISGASTSNGAKLVQGNWTGGNHQLFRPEPVENGYYRIVAKHSGQALDVPNSSTASRVDVGQWPWNGGDNQRWRL
ncbi:MAG TPA: RICIN domain-containing protein [Actinophytocola sp.]|uniref:RICIN domain-containing protein n=1 Tax=Actinophytocola sp. TaxID=1872138 RepID=UPI002DBFC48E|nr:RICIN domain-containing protein [Actinophytocola sp.]HEU5473871.1 RICIN domain-containing protein [Actinophytocola sp.]